VNDRILDIAELLILQKERPLTPQEQLILDQWVMENPDNASLVRQVQDEKWLESEIVSFSRYDVEKSRKILESRLTITRPVHRVHFLKTAWIRYAAAIIILFGIGALIYLTNQKEKPSVTQTNPNPVQNDVTPGGNKATLTLADGSKIILDSAKSGQLAREANATITKTSDGKIVYNADEKLGDRILMNTMSTPRGGQYQLALPDGSQVWLNAESSITYPTAFASNERKISVTGEAYFEIAKDKTKPFRVDIGNATIEVLGTHFNVNAYKEEPTKNITLLEGSVKISLEKSVHTSIILKPGQQGQLNPDQQKLSLAANPDVEQVMAWRNGLFNFNSRSFADVMQLLGRWYDVEIVYEGKIPDTPIRGEMGRDLNLSQVLNALKVMGVNYVIEGKKLIVRSKP
jgi:transmembrane sensor